MRSNKRPARTGMHVRADAVGCSTETSAYSPAMHHLAIIKTTLASRTNLSD